LSVGSYVEHHANAGHQRLIALIIFFMCSCSVSSGRRMPSGWSNGFRPRLSRWYQCRSTSVWPQPRSKQSSWPAPSCDRGPRSWPSPPCSPGLLPILIIEGVGSEVMGLIVAPPRRRHGHHVANEPLCHLGDLVIFAGGEIGPGTPRPSPWGGECR